MKTNRQYLTVKDREGGQRGLFLNTKGFNKDDIIFVLDCNNISSRRTRTSIQIHPEDLHCEDEQGAYMNHSSTPSCRIEGYVVLANYPILPGEELTFDYTTTESLISHGFLDKQTNKWIGEKNSPANLGYGLFTNKVRDKFKNK